jgi:hypothetical protein
MDGKSSNFVRIQEMYQERFGAIQKDFRPLHSLMQGFSRYENHIQY